jgi:hypothetical protein
MSIFRSYINKQSTLINSNVSNNTTNNSLNPIIELGYGNSSMSFTGSTVPISATTSSRYIFDVNLTPLKNKIDYFEYSQSLFTRHTLNFTNVISFNKDEIMNEFLSNKRAYGLTLVLYKLNQSFIQGNGYDYIYDVNTVTNTNKLNIPSNWIKRDTINDWTEPGTFVNLSNADILATQYIEYGYEDLNFDVTNYINNVLFSGTTHYGFGICISSSTETLKSEYYNIITFYSKNTNTFYKPYLQSDYNDFVFENRNKFYLDNSNTLCFSTSKALNSTPTVTIKNYNNTIYTTLTSTKVSKFLYKVSLNISSSSYPDLVNFYDEWTYNNKNRIQEFTLYDSESLYEMDNHINNYELWYGIHGIKNNQTITNSNGIKRINLNIKQLKDSRITNEPEIYNLQYRVYTTQGKNEIEIIPYTNISKVDGNYFFDIDFSWFIPQFYYLQIRINNNNIEYKNNQLIKFRVVESL